jgi:hypothetical protein
MDEDLLKLQYKNAIDARDKLNDNYHKWMTFYYVANAAILVAITALYQKDYTNPALLPLSVIGVFVCTLWHLSCKGYYYWSTSWINIILLLEKKVTMDKTELGVYSVFSKEVADQGDKIWDPTKSANISTPKLTLLFSLFAILGWWFYAVCTYINLCSYPLCCKITILTLASLVYVLFYFLLVPKYLKSRSNDSHKLV